MLKSDRFLRKYLENMGEIYTFVPVKLSHQLKINCNNERNYQGNDLLPSALWGYATKTGRCVL